MDFISAVIAGAAIAYFAYTLGMKKGGEIARPNCTHPEIAPAEEIAEAELTEEELSAAVIAYRARLARAEAARQRVTISEVGE